MPACRKSLRNKQIRFANENSGLFTMYIVTDDFVLDNLITSLGTLDGIGFIFTENADVCLACRILWKGKNVVLHFRFLFALSSRRPYLQTQKSVRKKTKQDLVTFTITA
jgi:hypothetical protein